MKTDGRAPLRTLLVATPLWDAESPAFSLVQLASHLADRGAPGEVRVLDFNLLAPELAGLASGGPEGIHPPLFRLGDSLEGHDPEEPADDLAGTAATLESVASALAEVVLQRPFDVLGVTISLASWFVALPMLRLVRAQRPDATIVCGGPHASFLAEVAARVRLPRFCRYMEEAACLLAVGEGEETLLEIVRRRAAGEQDFFPPPAGTVTFRGGQLVSGTRRPPIESLDLLASPDYSNFGLETASAFESVHVELSRGCVNRCVFCSDPGYWQDYRRRSPDKVRADLAAVRPRTSTGVIRLSDSGFYPWLPGQDAILDAFAAVAPPVIWSAYTTVRGMEARHAARMVEAGCRLVSFGVESGDPGQLRLMRKAVPHTEVARVIREANREGLRTEASLVVGFPGETVESLERTLALIDELLPETRVKVFEFMPVVFSRFLAERPGGWSEIFGPTPRPDAVVVGPGVFYHPPLYCPPEVRDRAEERLARLPVERDRFPRRTALRRVASADGAPSVGRRGPSGGLAVGGTG